jgi:hypothetical protein
MKSAFFIIAIIACASAVTITSHKLNALNNRVQFGNLFAEIRAQLKSGGPLANIEGLIDQLEGQIHTEQADHDAMLGRNRESCSTEQEFRQGEIVEGQASLKRSSDHMAACSASLGQAKTALAQTTEDLLDSKAALRSAIARRKEEAATFVQRTKDHARATKVVRGALSILDDMVVQQNFVQLAKHTKALLKSGLKVRLAKHYAPVLAMFAQMATSEQNMFLDVGAVNRIKSLLTELLSNISTSLNEYRVAEEGKKEAFLILQGKLNDSIVALSKNKMELEDHVETMQQCVLEEKVLVNASKTKLARNIKLFNLSKSMCAAFEKEFAAATNSRNEELKLLVQVRRLVKKRLDGLGSAVTSRDDSFTNKKVQKWEKGTFNQNGGDKSAALDGFGMSK